MIQTSWNNAPQDREITAQLYGGDLTYRLKQEIVLGLGGVRILHEIGFEIKKYHMNEGHASFLTLELLKRFKRPIEDVWDEKLVWDKKRVKDLCVFTTHTPVEAGHDKFPYDLVSGVMGEIIPIHCAEGTGRLGISEHDNACAEPQPLYQRSGQEARRGITEHVPWI